MSGGEGELAHEICTSICNLRNGGSNVAKETSVIGEGGKDPYKKY